MDKLDNLIKAAEKRGAAERLSRAGERVLGELGAEALAKGAELDETGSIGAMKETTRAVKTVTDLTR